ncbi:MAG TPA: hypothetical protein VLJ86_24765 [Ramlibacter sp.]|nr:hypothetical protein [Ramlibacter sp.]
MTPDDKLAAAFAAWSEARHELGKLRLRFAAAGKSALQARSPDEEALFRRIQAQEAVCTRAFAELVALADERAAQDDVDRAVEIQTRIQATLVLPAPVSTPLMSLASSPAAPPPPEPDPPPPENTTRK